MKLFWIFSLALAVASPAHAAQGWTAQEIAMLPPYCDAKIGRQAPEAVALWRERLGFENWIHMHHYCDGLIDLNRYYRGARGNQTANLGSAVNEFSGMLKAWTPDIYLRPEAHLNRGRAYKFMGHNGLALTDFQKALELAPRLAPASIELADLYQKLGKKTDALAVLKTGIERNPDTKSLRRRYAELGGDPKLLVVPPTPPVTDSASAPAVPQATTPEARTNPVAAETTPKQTEQAEPKIGTPKNPYCRFCPD